MTRLMVFQYLSVVPQDFMLVKKEEIIDLDENEMRRKEKTMARLIFIAAERKLENKKPTSYSSVPGNKSPGDTIDVGRKSV